jgi:hypothetical protein
MIFGKHRAQSASPDAPDGLKNASLKYWRFPGAMTIRSMHLRRGLHGVASAIWSPAFNLEVIEREG